ncbi:hypothetical protein ASF60_18080 [Methylobacterium sp. Leaf113]|uniref:hypothetical protein n=1 Tax=Methylobacterium sp. Leaf113 TaxID=1736259 RepID=UPI0006F50AED|nr:hypothetical protein [Methylobacterium sp. Leaf113]KQP91353.1 hypothetical protein ASF60_18080 [Methylobacterium sp. Leaf113]
MRALLSLVAGGPGRVSTSAAALVIIAFVASGHGMDLLVATWFALIFAAAFCFAFAVLAMIGAATGVADGDSAIPAPRRADQ